MVEFVKFENEYNDKKLKEISSLKKYLFLWYVFLSIQFLILFLQFFNGEVSGISFFIGIIVYITGMFLGLSSYLLKKEHILK